jgi:hypothetical protein
MAKGGETIASFSKQTLGFDLAAVPFGKSAQTNGGYGETTAPATAGNGELPKADFLWMTNGASAKYDNDFPNRSLKYGFRDGKLAAVRISIGAFGRPGFSGEMANQELFKQRRNELVKIQNALRDASPNHHLSFDDASFHIQYGAMCAPIPESLFLMEIQITPLEKKKAP